MKIFSCSACGSVLFFENSQCTQCGRVVAYLQDRSTLGSLDRGTQQGERDDLYASVPDGKRYRLCRNYTELGVCNWAIPEGDSDPLCRSCVLNVTIPNLSQPSNIDAWARLERAKRRLIHTLVGLNLPVESRSERSKEGLAFAFKQDQGSQEKVFTGHEDGLITINVAEADTPFLEKTRVELGERYRTLLGHFRHESGHYYWSRLIERSDKLESFRARFADERLDYGAASRRHYEQGAPADWALHFVSPYASMHPSEDWAETWAHYLHMVDTLETARSFGMALRPAAAGATSGMTTTVRHIDFDDFEDLIGAWLPLTIAVNSLNRSMGLPDAYPFVLCDEAILKLRFVHEVIEQAAATRKTQPADQPGLGAA